MGSHDVFLTSLQDSAYEGFAKFDSNSGTSQVRAAPRPRQAGGMEVIPRGGAEQDRTWPSVRAATAGPEDQEEEEPA